MKLFSFGLSSFFIGSTASAHTGIDASSMEHSLLHVSSSAGLALAIVITAYCIYRFQAKPKAKRIRIRVKK